MRASGSEQRLIKYEDDQYVNNITEWQWWLENMRAPKRLINIQYRCWNLFCSFFVATVRDSNYCYSGTAPGRLQLYMLLKLKLIV